MLKVRSVIKKSPLCSVITIALLGLSGCSENQSVKNVQLAPPSVISIAPGAPGADPVWAFSGKTGIGTSYEPYTEGQYQGSETNPISKVWFSVAQGILTETMYGMIHNAQLKELQFVIVGNGFIDTEKDHTNSTIEYTKEISDKKKGITIIIKNKDVS